MKRLYNHADAIDYIGCKKSFFDTNIAPRVTWTRAGTCMLAERKDLDLAWEEYKAELAAGILTRKENPWAEKRPGSTKTETGTGKSTRYTSVVDFDKASAKAMRKLKAGLSTSSQS